MLLDFLQVLPERQPQLLRAEGQQVRWQPQLKANFDGAVSREDKRAGLGVVIQNHQGQVLASLSKNIMLPPSIEDVEALAAVRAVSFAAGLGFSSIIIEGDSEVVIKALKCKESLTMFGHLISVARLTMDVLCSFSFSHTHRQGNSIARNLIRHASGYLV